MNNKQFHIDFKLNGNSFLSVDDLLVYANSLSVHTQQFLRDWFSKSDVISVRTSGSTGAPKTIQLKKEFMINSALATGQFFGALEKTTALLCMSAQYIAGKMMLVRALVLGWHMDCISPVARPLEGLAKTYDFSAMVPMQLQNSLAEIHKVKTLLVGGGAVHVGLERKLDQIATRVFATFGMTETITHIAAKPLNHSASIENKACNDLKDHKNTKTMRSIHDASVYRTLPHVTISQDKRGCLVVNAPKVSENKIITNDVVSIISDTAFKWLGRIDHVINSGGIKIHPEVVEKQLATLISQRFFVAGIPDEQFGEKLVLLVEGEPSEIKLNKVSGLSKYELPKQIYFVQKFMETETKKIQRSATLDLIL